MQAFFFLFYHSIKNSCVGPLFTTYLRSVNLNKGFRDMTSTPCPSVMFLLCSVIFMIYICKECSARRVFFSRMYLHITEDSFNKVTKNICFVVAHSLLLMDER